MKTWPARILVAATLSSSMMIQSVQAEPGQASFRVINTSNNNHVWEGGQPYWSDSFPDGTPYPGGMIINMADPRGNMLLFIHPADLKGRASVPGTYRIKGTGQGKPDQNGVVNHEASNVRWLWSWAVPTAPEQGTIRINRLENNKLSGTFEATVYYNGHYPPNQPKDETRIKGEFLNLPYQPR